MTEQPSQEYLLPDGAILETDNPETATQLAGKKLEGPIVKNTQVKAVRIDPLGTVDLRKTDN